MKFEINSTIFDIPLSLDELEYHRFIDMQKAVELMNNDVFEARKEIEDRIERENLTQMQAAKLLATAGAIDDGHIHNIVSKAVTGDLSKLPNDFPDELLSDLFNIDFFLTFGKDVSVQRLYVHLFTIIDNFYDEKVHLGKSVNHSVEWFETAKKRKPCVYVIERGRTQSMITGERVKFTTGETIEIKEWQRLTNGAIKSKGDPEGNFAFSLGLAEVSIICRKPGEELPFLKSERDAFIKQRMKIFSDLPTSEVLRVRFFLLRILRDWLIAKNLERSLKERNLISTETPLTKNLSAKRYRGLKTKRRGRGT